MNPLGLAAALVAALAHVAFFGLESVLFMRPTTFGRFGLRTVEDASIVRPWAFNQGFYNLFLAAGAAGGVLAAVAGHTTVGRTLVLFACGCMAIAGVVLVATDRRFAAPALVQVLPPLVVFASLAF
jgi:putative membrane protein